MTAYHGFPADRRINDADMLHRFTSIIDRADLKQFEHVVRVNEQKDQLPLVATYLMDTVPTYAVFCTDTILTYKRYVMSLFVTRNYEEAMIVHSQMLHETIHGMNHPED